MIFAPTQSAQCYIFVTLSSAVQIFFNIRILQHIRLASIKSILSSIKSLRIADLATTTVHMYSFTYT